MSHDLDRPTDGLACSRRGFLESSVLLAGAGLLTARGSSPANAAQKGSAAGSAARHPLDPLSAEELSVAVQTLRTEKKLGDHVRIVSAVLLEPERRTTGNPVASSEPVSRQAFLVLRDNKKRIGCETVVDVTNKSVVRYTELPSDLQPAVMLDEFGECEEAVKRSPLFLEALKKRGVENVDLVMVEPWSAGNYGTEVPEDKGRRLLRALCFVRSEPKDNGYARPLDGVVVVVDLDTMQVIRLEDYGVVPLPPESGNWAREYIPKTRGGLKPIEIHQPEGASFSVDGYQVRWQNWSFRIGFTPREGLVLHQLAYDDEGRTRSILARASVCEMVVPYGDPGEQYYRKNAFDIGEYGIGTLANSLNLGCDCLGTIRYFDAHMLDSRGHVQTIKNAVCLHEEDAGLLWKHTDWRTNQSETRRSRRLSVSFIATVGNYEYGFFWHLYLDGSIHCEIKLTGVMNTTALRPGAKSEFGVEIAPQLNAPFHQHIFAARLDTAVDGERNTIHEVNVVRLSRGPQNPHGNAFRAESTPLLTEGQAKRSVQSSTARFWRIVNPSRKNRLDQPVAYRLLPGENGPPFVQPDAAVMRRAGFAAHNVWVTPYTPEEKYPAGDYPNQHARGDGLSQWTAANRSVENAPLVLWYVFSHAHIPRVEDWPVMPVSSSGFLLRPDGFFGRNPALDLPPPVV